MTWTAPTGNAELLGYLVSFERLTGRGCDSLHHDAYGVNNITIDYTVMGLSGLSTYTIGVAAVSIFGSSKVVPSDTIDTLPSRESSLHHTATLSSVIKLLCVFMILNVMYNLSVFIANQV